MCKTSRTYSNATLKQSSYIFCIPIRVGINQTTRAYQDIWGFFKTFFSLCINIKRNLTQYHHIKSALKIKFS